MKSIVKSVALLLSLHALSSATASYSNSRSSERGRGRGRGVTTLLAFASANAEVQETPVESVAAGLGTFDLNEHPPRRGRRNDDPGEICFEIQAGNFVDGTDVTLIHIHEGTADINGPVVVDFLLAEMDDTQFFFEGCVDVPVDLIQRISRRTGGVLLEQPHDGFSSR